jgi:hypothetical protein
MTSATQPQSLLTYFAAHALQGLLAKGSSINEQTAEDAVKMAYLMLEELRKPAS